MGYFIPQASLDLEVTTPGGGGDNVRYFPYRDIDAGFQRMLANVFETAVRVASMPSSADMQRDGMAVILSPILITSSRSTGVFTWPPTNFSTDITALVRGAPEALVCNPRSF